MPDLVESLSTAIQVIKMKMERMGQIITNEEIAEKASISEEQLHAYSIGEKKMPDDFVFKLLATFGMKVELIEFTETIDLEPLEEEEDEDERA